MLLDFEVKNYLSFKDTCECSCIATSEKQHLDRLSHGPFARMKILPTVAIFGSNGAGKSNLIKALQFCRFMILKGVGAEQQIPVTVFRLAGDSQEESSRFNLIFLQNEKVYQYTFSINRKRVVEESLKQIRASSEVLIFSRKFGSNGTYEWELDVLQKGMSREKDFIGFKARDTLPNQLFLQEMRGKGIAVLDETMAWFRDCLEVVEPHTNIKPFEIVGPDEQLEAFASNMLRHADTGISRVQFEPLENVPMPEADLQNIREHLKDEKSNVLIRSDDGRRIRFKQVNGELMADRLVTYHQDSNGKDVRFEIMEESHGTRRFIDLLPLFYSLVQPNSKKVFVCDELDGNLHPLIIQGLLREYHQRCGSNHRAQLMFTSHDVTLFDQYLLRRDEIWMVSKKRDGSSYFECLGDYKDVRKGTDILKGYLLGRYSGVPRMGELFGAEVN